LGLPVVRPGRLARADDPDRHPQHREERLGLVLVVAGQRDGVALAGLVEPAAVADVHHEPALARRYEPGPGVFELRLLNHGSMIGRRRWPSCSSPTTCATST